jgi:4a-hydroxytetrahydrobiopterin dehydratase
LGSLEQQQCEPCEGGVDPLGDVRAALLVRQVPGWGISGDGMAIRRGFQFRGFLSTMSFINAMAWIANQQGHHPDFDAGYDYCSVTFTTHAIGGLSENDFICAAKLNALVEA